MAMNQENPEPKGRKGPLGFYVALVFLLLAVGGALAGSPPATYIGLVGILLCTIRQGFLIRPDVTCMGLGGAVIFGAGLFAWLEFDVASWSPYHSLSERLLFHCGMGAVAGIGMIITGVVFWCRRPRTGKLLPGTRSKVETKEKPQ